MECVNSWSNQTANVNQCSIRCCCDTKYCDVLILANDKKNEYFDQVQWPFGLNQRHLNIIQIRLYLNITYLFQNYYFM